MRTICPLSKIYSKRNLVWHRKIISLTGHLPCLRGPKDSDENDIDQNYSRFNGQITIRYTALAITWPMTLALCYNCLQLLHRITLGWYVVPRWTHRWWPGYVVPFRHGILTGFGLRRPSNLLVCPLIVFTILSPRFTFVYLHYNTAADRLGRTQSVQPNKFQQ